MAKRMNKQQRLAAMEEAWDLRRQGKSMHTIAARMKISSSTVHELLQARAAEVSERLAGKVAELRAEQTERLDHIIEEALDAWERSKSGADMDKTVTKSLSVKPNGGGEEGEEDVQMVRGEDGRDHAEPAERPGMYLDDDGEEVDEEERALIAAAAAEGEEGGPTLSVVQETRTKEHRHSSGDPRFLAEAQKAMDAQRAIWGIETPKDKAATAEVVVKVYQGVDVEAEV